MWPGSGRATQKPWPTGQISGRVLARPSPKRSLCMIGMLSFRKYYMILMGRGDLYFFFQFDKIMHYFISILEHCTQLNYTLHSKYHTYIGENFKKIRIEKNIILNCNWQMMFGLEEEFFFLMYKKVVNWFDDVCLSLKKVEFFSQQYRKTCDKSCILT